MTEASLNNISLELETISDSFNKAIAKRHIPFSDDTHLTDMGLKERKIKLRCYFWADTYEKHKELLALLWGNTDFELNHPEYGLLKGKVESVSVRDDDRENTAEIDLDFVVGKSKSPEAVSMDIEGESEELYVSGIKEIEQDYRDNLIAGSVLPVEIIDTVLDPETATILEQMPVTLSPSGRTYIKQLDAMLGVFNTSVAAVSLPVNSLLADINFTTGIPGRVMSIMAGFAEKQISIFQTLRSSPDRFVSSLITGLSRFEGTLPDAANEKACSSVIALSASKELGLVYAEDEVKRSKRKRLETVKIFDDLSRMKNIDPVAYPMNVREVEKTLYDVREMNAVTIADNREIESLKLLSDKLLDHVVKIKLDREKIIRIEVENEMPLHLVCLKYSLPYQAADRIMLINRIKHPSFTRGGIDIYES
ncbi:MAG: DNA circularization N-terminal domain-containing protein [Desulfobacula sp.]|nr:DNA circularization N-terminal domain-containing protein [Desulfobacula sp.]